MIARTAKALLMHEVHALRARLESVKPFSMHMPMVMAAAISPTAMTAVEEHVSACSQRLRDHISDYVNWLLSEEGKSAPPAIAQRKYTSLRLLFASMLSHFEIFADTITQRSEHDYGVWLSGLDVLAEEALTFPGAPYQVPPVICYLDRAIGGAIRRYHTRLPGGANNPVTIIRVPRERMIGSGIAASIVHECGHQVAALLKMNEPLKAELKSRSAEISDDPQVVAAFIRWLPEIVSDFWSVGRLGIAASLGVMTVVSLPPRYVIRIDPNGTHPVPWIRVKLSAAMGNELYPDLQWETLSAVWEQLYPLHTTDEQCSERMRRMERALPVVAQLIADHCPNMLAGRSLRDVLPARTRRPADLRRRFEAWEKGGRKVLDEEPTAVFAITGQAKFDGRLPTQEESRFLNQCLRRWALRRALDTGAKCAVTLRASSHARSLNLVRKGVEYG